MAGHVPSWVRKSFAKTKKFADGGEVESEKRSEPEAKEDSKPSRSSMREMPSDNRPGVRVVGGGSGTGRNFGMGGRISKSFDVDDDSSVDVGVSGSFSRSGGGRVEGVDVSYNKKNERYGVEVSRDEVGGPKVMARYSAKFANGGKVRKC